MELEDLDDNLWAEVFCLSEDVYHDCNYEFDEHTSTLVIEGQGPYPENMARHIRYLVDNAGEEEEFRARMNIDDNWEMVE